MTPWMLVCAKESTVPNFPGESGQVGVPNRPSGPSGPAIVRASATGTIVFGVASVVAVIDDGLPRAIAVAVDLGLFVLGCAAFLWAFVLALGRSRNENIGIGGLYFLTGCAPATVRRRMMGLLAVQVIVAVVAALWAPYTAVAASVLVPVYGLGLAGLWGAHHGRFGDR